MDFIDNQKVAFPDLAEQYENLGNLFEKKLWHQLSVSLESFISNANNVRNNNILELYERFISTFEARLDQVKLATLLSLVGGSIKDDSGSLVFFDKILVNRERLGLEASLCLDMDIVIVKTRLNLLSDLKTKLDEAKECLQTIQSSESVAYSKYYRAVVGYRKVVGPPQEFFTAALMFLSFTPLESLSAEERYVLATDMALASITGEETYNFGEVIATPILSSLQNTPNAWMFELVHVLNRGDIDQFNQLVDTHRAQYSAQPSLTGRHEMVKQKVVLLSLVNIAFERPSHDRQISFADIAAVTKIPLNQVEWVLMRAMSLKLIRGTIDEVDGLVSVTWVQPRVLDKRQLALLGSQLDGWTERVKTSLVTIEDHTPDLYM